MPTIRWTGPGVFTDRQREFEARPGSEHDVGEEQAEAYLEHEQFSHRFERVGPEEDDKGDKPDMVFEGRDQSTEEALRKRSDESEDEDDYETYPREDLESKEYDELQELAMESDNDDINGRSSGDEIIEALAEN